MDGELQEFFARLKSARKQRDWGIKVVARRTGVCYVTAWRWETNRYPTTECLIRLCKALDVSSDWLLGLKEENERNAR